jgi:hypothetical protein
VTLADTTITPAALLNITYLFVVSNVVLTLALVVVVALYVGEVGDRRARRRRRDQPETRRRESPSQLPAATQEIPRYPHPPTYRPGAVAVGRPGTDLVHAPHNERMPARQR